ncbi:MAG: CinA family protein [Kiritimatiellia bacterium]
MTAADNPDPEPSLQAEIAQIGALCKRKGLYIGTAESCTGGLLAAAFTGVSGASNWFMGGVVSYALSVKEDLLGVPPEILAAYGPVSAPVAEAMARGALRTLGCDLALSITGQAGPEPDGLSPEPVGTVYIGWADSSGAGAKRFSFPGDRSAVRHAAVQNAVSLLLTPLSTPPRQ